MAEIKPVVDLHEPQVVVLPECVDKCKKLSLAVGEALLNGTQNPDGQYSVVCGKAPGRFGACHSDVFKRGSYVSFNGSSSFVENPSDIERGGGSQGTVRDRVRGALALGAIDIPLEDIQQVK